MAATATMEDIAMEAVVTDIAAHALTIAAEAITIQGPVRMLMLRHPVTGHAPLKQTALMITGLE
jgi:hypothetical protein